MMNNHIIYVFILLYSGRRRVFPIEYCRTFQTLILFMCLFIFIAAAGAFFQVNIVETDEHKYHLRFYSSL